MLIPSRTEIIPADGIVEAVAAHLRPGSTVTVTALPKHAIETTLDVALRLARAGFDAVPHIAATRLHGLPHLGDLLRRLEDSPIGDLFLIGGDGRHGENGIRDGLRLLERTRELSGTRFRIGVAAYPEGHQAFPTGEGVRLLRRKAALADYAVTQLCFDAGTMAAYVRRARDAGIDLPLWLGVPGTVSLRRLIDIAGRVGVGPSLSFLAKGGNRRLIGAYDAAGLQDAALAKLNLLGIRAAGFQVSSFNAVEAVATARR